MPPTTTPSSPPAAGTRHHHRTGGGVVAALAALVLPSAARASFLPPALMDSAAWGVAWFVVVVMPIAGIALFWMVHVLPEKIAEKRHHPQTDAIQVLCLLSLVFGGLLWPFAWLWAYTKPVMHRMAYGTEKHDDYFLHMAGRAEAGEIGEGERRHLLDELDAIAERGPLSREQKEARARIVAAPATPPPPAAGERGAA